MWTNGTGSAVAAYVPILASDNVPVKGFAIFEDKLHPGPLLGIQCAAPAEHGKSRTTIPNPGEPERDS